MARSAAPTLDIEEADTFLYPAGDYAFRAYQHSMIKAAFDRNLLVSLPTGTGKTLIASVFMYNMLRWFPDGIVVFMAPTRPLVAQQVKACCRTVGLSTDVAQMLTGDDAPALRRKLWAASERRLIFCTPHVFKNDLENGLLDARRVVCAVFDECHHAATEKTVYAHVARHLREGRGKDHVCRVLALSATAGTTLGKVQGVIDALGISRVEMRTEENLREYMHQTDLRIVTIRQPRVQALTSKGGGGGGGGASKAQNRATLRELLLLYGHSQMLRLQGVNALPRTAELRTLDSAQMDSCARELDARENAPGGGRQLFQPASYSSYENTSLRRAHGLLSSLVTATELALGPIKPGEGAGATQRGGGGEDDDDADGDDEQEEVSTPPEASSDLAQRRAEISSALDRAKANGLDETSVNELKGLALAAACGRNQGVSMTAEWRRLVPKLTSLTELLQSHFNKAPSSRVIAFVTRRATVSALCEQLSNAPETRGVVKAVPFVGRSNRGGDLRGAGAQGMDQAMQQKVLNDFKAGLVNVLVATSVAEEGLDIGEVDLIVCFDPVTSPIRLVQRLGRTGRAADGEAILLLTPEEKFEHEQTAQRAKDLQQMIDTGRGLSLKPPSNPPFLPSVPKCVYYNPKEMMVDGIGAPATASKKKGEEEGGARKENTGANKKRDSFDLLKAMDESDDDDEFEGAAAAAKKRPVVSHDEDDSEEDVPLAQRKQKKAKKTPPSSKGKDSGGGANAKQPARKTPPQQEKKQSDGDLWTADRSKPTAATIDKPQKKTKTPPRQQQQVVEVVSKPNQQQQQPTASVEEELLAAGARRSSIEPEAQKEVVVELMEPVEAAAVVAPAERAVALAPEWRLVAPWSSKQWLSSAQLDSCADGVVPVECRRGERWWWN